METTARFYLERMRAQVDQACRRRYPTASDAPAKWLQLISGKLKGVEVRLNDPDFLADDRTKAELLLTDIKSCYDDLQILGRADTTQVADFVVSALHRWFIRTDPACDYLFTSGITFEVEPIYDGPPPEFFHEKHREAARRIHAPLYRITMPGGALGASFHIPLVTHEIGHVLMFRLEREELSAEIDELCGADGDETYRNWVKEIIADTVCGFIAGPAAFFAMYESLRGAGDDPDEEHPHNFIRLSSLFRFISERFQDAYSLQHLTADSWTAWCTWPDATLLVMQYNGYDRQERPVNYTELSLRLIDALPKIRAVATKIASEYLADLEYTPKQLSNDLDNHLDAFLHAIPPYETAGDLRHRKPTELTTILNVGWFVAAFAMERAKFAGPYGSFDEGAMLVCLDQLMLKAIELSEIRRDWATS